MWGGRYTGEGGFQAEAAARTPNMSSAFRAHGRSVLSAGSGLYAIVDVDAVHGRALDCMLVARALLAAHVRVLQLRAKGRPDPFVLETLQELRALVPRGGDCLLFANDRPDLAELAGVDGVHLGQGDLPAAEVRRHYPDLLVGVSTHDALQFEAALAVDIDYVALGPIFPTLSKRDAEPTVGLETLELLGERARSAGRPLVAIGGINVDNLHAVRAHAAHWAVISALLPEHQQAPDPYLEITRRARHFA